MNAFSILGEIGIDYLGSYGDTFKGIVTCWGIFEDLPISQKLENKAVAFEIELEPQFLKEDIS